MVCKLQILVWNQDNVKVGSHLKMSFFKVIVTHPKFYAFSKMSKIVSPYQSSIICQFSTKKKTHKNYISCNYMSF